MMFQVHELPPSYTIAIEDSGGILNQSFTNDETPARSENQNEAGSSNNESRESDITNMRGTNDTVLYI